MDKCRNLLGDERFERIFGDTGRHPEELVNSNMVAAERLKENISQERASYTNVKTQDGLFKDPKSVAEERPTACSINSINVHGLNLVKSFEGGHLVSYRDVAGILTIGYGCIRGVREGMTLRRNKRHGACERTWSIPRRPLLPWYQPFRRPITNTQPWFPSVSQLAG